MNIPALAQDLEPRSLSSAPIKSNFFLAGYAYAQGNLLLDAALPIEDLNSKVNTFLIAYVRSINLFGISAKYSVIMPVAKANYKGIHYGEDKEVDRRGLGDVYLGFSFNFLGAPAYSFKDYPIQRDRIVSGLSFQLCVPVGQYDKTRLLNLGSNRWTIKTQLGVSKKLSSWFLEAYGSVRFFTDNPAFYNSGTLSQKPVLAIKSHLIKTFKGGAWIELGAGYGYGGQVFVNDMPKDVKMSTIRIGTTLAYPITINHSLRITAMSGRRWEQGPDFDGVALTYQYRWISKKHQL